MAEDLVAVAQDEWTLTVAQWFHSVYEQLAPQLGWETQKRSRVSWDDVPAENKALMLATAQEVLRRLILDAGWLPPAEAERLRARAEESALSSIEARNPGIDIGEIREQWARKRAERIEKLTVEELEAAASFSVPALGDRVRITDRSHPWAGRAGIVSDARATDGVLVVRLDGDGVSVNVWPGQWARADG